MWPELSSVLSSHKPKNPGENWYRRKPVQELHSQKNIKNISTEIKGAKMRHRRMLPAAE
jgi:hypothetical protein